MIVVLRTNRSVLVVIKACKTFKPGHVILVPIVFAKSLVQWPIWLFGATNNHLTSPPPPQKVHIS